MFLEFSIHNTNVIAAMKEDKKTALELNRRLFDIVDIIYGNSKNTYHEPIFPNEFEKDLLYVSKEEKLFDKCIICGKSCSLSKSNFCSDCDNILNYVDVLSQFLSQNGKNSFFTLADFNYLFKNQMFKDLISDNVIEKVGNKYHFLADNLDEFFILSEIFMEIDNFLVNVIKGNIRNPTENEMYKSNDYPFSQVSIIVNEFYISNLIQFLEDGKSLKYSLEHIGISKSDFDMWYDNKKSAFIGGNKDKKFIEFNELLIKDYFKSIENNGPKNIYDDNIDFWLEYFDEFYEKYAEYKLKEAIYLLKKGYKKETVLDKLSISENDLRRYLSIHKVLADEYNRLIDKRKDLVLDYVQELSLNEAIEKSKLTMDDIEIDRKEFLNGNDNDFYQNLTETLMRRYLTYRENGLSTDEISSKLTIEKSEIDLWLNDERFKDFQNDYSKIRLKLFKKAFSEYKSKAKILNQLEITEEELNEYVELGREGVEDYIDYYNIFQEEYYPYLIKVFLKEFSEKSNLNEALKKCDLTKEELNNYLNSNEELYNQFINVKIDIIASRIVDKGKSNHKFLKKLDMSNKERNQFKRDIDEKVIEKQIEKLIDEIPNGKITLDICNEVHCKIDTLFEWIYKGSLGDEKFKELASTYWEENLFIIDDANSELREKESIRAVRDVCPKK